LIKVAVPLVPIIVLNGQWLRKSTQSWASHVYNVQIISHALLTLFKLSLLLWFGVVWTDFVAKVL
jgi:hypothetical protein